MAGRRQGVCVASASAKHGGAALDEGAAPFVEIGGGGTGDEGFTLEVQAMCQGDIGPLAYSLLGGGERERRLPGDVYGRRQLRRDARGGI